MKAVAAEADVAVKTVYLAFESKRGLLLALWHLLLRGDGEPVPVAERPWFREVIEEQDPERQLQLNARNSRVVKERAGALMKILRDAAPADRELETLWNRIQTEFHANQRSIVDNLHERNALRAGLGVGDATDILWTLNHPDVFWLLVDERGWTAEQYETWLADAFSSQLLGQHLEGDEPVTGGATP